MISPASFHVLCVFSLCERKNAQPKKEKYHMKLGRFALYAWAVLVYNLLVILWGAFVRASGSGAGCGSHWPLCNGEVIPLAPPVATLIEFSHRLTTGLAGLLVIGLVVWAFRAFPRGNSVRLGAALSLAFILIEGLVGALQVRLGLTADNASVGRAVVGSIHLANTFLMLAALTLTAWWAGGGASLQLRNPDPSTSSGGAAGKGHQRARRDQAGRNARRSGTHADRPRHCWWPAMPAYRPRRAAGTPAATGAAASALC